ncbi:MAG: hypothetical protein C6W56_11640 [Caldibacillus debilis]|nr:MAG: hypothetical protein C6W56_11640 [Caldibacillus debilis]
MVFSEGAWHCFYSTGRQITGEEAGRCRSGESESHARLNRKDWISRSKRPSLQAARAPSVRRSRQGFLRISPVPEGWRILSDFADKFSFNHFANHL